MLFFIIKLLLRNYFKDKSDFLLDKPKVRVAVTMNLQLLENQLPYFVSKELCMLAFPNVNSKPNATPPGPSPDFNK